MSEYNQRYSDLDDIPLVDTLFFIRLHENKMIYEQQEIERAKNKNNDMKRSR